MAEVQVAAKRDRRYKSGGPGTILSIRVYFREELQEPTIEEARAFMLKAELARRLEHYKKERDHLFIIHRMGPHMCEAVAGGTVQELRSTRCVEVCGDNVSERLALDLDE